MEAASTQPPWEQGDTIREGTHTVDDRSPQETVVDEFAERPEVFVGAAFAGGLALALILRRFGSE